MRGYIILLKSDIIVVEGVHDVIRVQSVYKDAQCVITNGSEISEETIRYIKELSKSYNIVVFTDPDSPGERIRKIITEAVPNCKQAFLRKKDCISNNHKKVGIEHASREAIINALENVYEYSGKDDVISVNELYELELIGGKESQVMRDRISDYLNIGKPNGKTFLKRLNLLQIDKEALEEIICKIK